jgi:hypothetical protein
VLRQRQRLDDPVGELARHCGPTVSVLCPYIRQ